MPSLLGTTLSGRYRLDARIDSGGMSTVYLAYDQTLERNVAAKILHRDFSDDPDQLERFRREARAVARLSHPHIVNVIDTGEDDNRPYIVFEYVAGETLKQRIARLGRLPISEAVAYAIEIARALGYAHQNQIVHRDVKPQNVLIDAEGTAKITDFGIALTLDQDGLTADGRVLGTTDYVSPEQALGHEVTGQSDLYSLGIVLFEMLTGDVPFRGENQVVVAMMHVRDEIPDVQIRRPQISSTLAAIVDRAAEKDLDERYIDDREMIADLENARAVEASRAGGATGEAAAVIRSLPEQSARRIPLRVRHPGWLVAAVAVAVAVAVVVVIGLAGGAEKGTGRQHLAVVPKGLGDAISLSQTAAKDFDPLGDNTEHGDEVSFIIDGDPNTTWSTESYPGALLTKPGVGITLDANPGVAAVLMGILTPTPGFVVEVYGAQAGPPTTLAGWTPLSPSSTVTERTTRIALSTQSTAYRYYLLWITKLPKDVDQVRISELTLFPRG